MNERVTWESCPACGQPATVGGIGQRRSERAIPTRPRGQARLLEEGGPEAEAFVAGAVKVSHWAPPDIPGDILRLARRADAADPAEIRVRPELHHRLVQQVPAALLDRGSLRDLDGIRLVVDQELPAFPGYEIHRVRPGSGTREERPMSSDSSSDCAEGSRAA